MKAARELVEDRQRDRHFASKRRSDPRGGGRRIDCGRQYRHIGEHFGIRIKQHRTDTVFEPLEPRLAAGIGERLAFGAAQEQRVSVRRGEEVAHSREVIGVRHVDDSKSVTTEWIDQLGQGMCSAAQARYPPQRKQRGELWRQKRDRCIYNALPREPLLCLGDRRRGMDAELAQHCSGRDAAEVATFADGAMEQHRDAIALEKQCEQRGEIR